MIHNASESSINKTARIAGWLYLSLLPLGIFGMAAGSQLIVPGDPTATLQHILASEPLFRLTIVTALLVQIVNIFVVLELYKLLKPVSQNMAVLMVVFILLGAPIAMLNELNQFAVLLAAHDPGQLQGLAPLFLALHNYGISIAGIFWGLWLFPMGYLVFKSGFLPKILGILLIIGCLGYLVDSFAAFLIPNNTVSIAMFTFWGEVALPLWLIIKGVNVEKWTQRALAPA